MHKAISNRHVLLIGAGIFLATVLTFAVNVRNEFIRYDDYDYIVKNLAISKGLNRPMMVWAFRSAGYASNFHPLTWISHAADVTLAKMLHIPYAERENDRGVYFSRKGGFATMVHAGNILWHGANAVLLWLVIMALGRTSDEQCGAALSGKCGPRETESPALLAAFFALVWALHPLRVEVVAWAAERKELLSVFFMLLTVLTYVRGECGSRGARALPIVFFALALLAKPVAVSLPAVLFAYDWALRGKTFREACSNAFPFVCFSAAACVATMSAQVSAIEAGRDFTPLQKWLSVVEAPAIYLAQTVWPCGLSIDYPMPGWETWPWLVGGVVVVVAMVAVCIRYVLMRVNRSAVDVHFPPTFLSFLVFEIAWAYIGLLPMIGIVKVGCEPHSDRYTYWIGCGVAVVAFFGVQRLWPLMVRQARQIAYGGALAVLVALVWIAVGQSSYWKSTEALFARVVDCTKNETYAQPLSEIMIFDGEGSGRFKRAEKMLRDVQSYKRTPEARAALALFLATFGAKDARGGFDEARIMANMSLDESEMAGIWAWAALGFADWREKNYKSAYANMKKAIDAGYKNPVGLVKLDEWKAKADEAAAHEGKEGK